MKPSLKKLTVVFLVVAIFTSSAALGLSAFINKPSKKIAAVAQENSQAEASAYKIYGAGPNGQNLTEEVTGLFARQLVAANPSGPQVNEDGTVLLVSPTTTEIFSYLATNPPSEELIKPKVDESRIQVLENFQTSDVSHYLNEVVQIQNNLTSNSLWQAGLTAGEADPATAATWMPEAGKMLAGARDELYATKVPAPFIPLQKSLLAFFSTTASFSDMVVQDPMAALALANNLDLIVAGQSEDITKAVQDIQSGLPELIVALPEKDSSLLHEIFGIQTAYATIPTIDWAHIGTTIASWAKEFWLRFGDQIKSHALGFLKNKLVGIVQKKITEVAKNNSIANWLVYQVDAGLSARLGLISRRQATLCGNAATEGLYGEILASALGVPTEEAGVGGVDETLGDTPGCPPVSSGFYRDDNTYKAKDFLQSLENNVMNDMITLKSEGLRAAGAASQAAVHEGLSGRGALDIKKCDDGTPVDNEGRCGDGSYARVITPGSTMQDILSKSVGSVVDIITAANNEHTYSAIIAVLETALLNYLWSKGEGLFQNSSDSGGSRRPPPPPATTASLEPQLAWYADQLETALNRTNGAIANYQQAVSLLRGSLSVCGEASADQILGLITGFETAIASFNAEAARIQGLLNTVQQFQTNPSVHTQSELNSRVGTAAAITDLVTRAAADSAKAEGDTAAAISLFQSCPSPT